MILSDPVTNHQDDVRDHAVKAEHGTITDAKPVDGDTDEWLVTVDPDDGANTTVKVEPGGACGEPGVLCTADGGKLDKLSMEIVEAHDAGPFTARFENGPGTHDGQSTFHVDLVFSDPPANGANRDIKAAIGITGGGKKQVRRVDGGHAHRRIGIAPNGDGDVVLTLMPTADCADTHALCTADGRKLESLLRLTVPGPASGPAPLTATFEQVPKEHEGKARLDVEVRFSEPPAGGRSAVQSAIRIERGVKGSVKRIDATGQRYRAAIRPEKKFRSIVITIPPTRDCEAEGALCSVAGGRLETGLRLEIPGPAALSASDAEVEEGPGATLDFVVSMNRARHAGVRVDYATLDGTAKAGTDYTATRGTLRFAAGETAKTVQVAVVDDAHDDDAETVRFLLFNPKGARIEDGRAIGTIHNSDPMPKAWLGRLGRTAAEQYMKAAQDRLRYIAKPGSSVSIAGYSLSGAAPGASLALTDEPFQRPGDREPFRGGFDTVEPEAVALTDRGLLVGTAFSVAAGDSATGKPITSLWGRGAVSSFEGQEGKLTVEGEVTTAMLGADVVHDRWTAGAIVAHTQADGSYSEANQGTVTSDLTGVYPYGRYALTGRLTAWGIGGYGRGRLGLRPDGEETIETDIDLVMGGMGVRGLLRAPSRDEGLEMALTSDVLGARSRSEATQGLAAAEADVTRLRLGVESTWRGARIGGGKFSPGLDLALRHDGGDAETGFGLDLGSDVDWSHPGSGFRVGLAGRVLLVH